MIPTHVGVNRNLSFDIRVNGHDPHACGGEPLLCPPID